MTTKEVATKPKQEIAPAADYEQFAGAGFEHQTGDDYTIPFIHVLQALSPQLETNDALRAGMLVNTVTGETWSGKTGIAFVPATTRHQWIEWRPRAEGGGFIAAHSVDSEVVRRCKAEQAFGDYTTPEGNELSETFYVYGVAVDDAGAATEAVLAFTSSKIKRYKAWMTKAKMVRLTLPDGRQIPAPLFAHRYRLTTITEKNSKGTFSNWDIHFDGANAAEARLSPDDPLFQRAADVKQMLDTGAARADYERQE